MDRIGIGVIGVGQIARGYHLPAIAALDGVRCVAVADVVPGRAEEIARQYGFQHADEDYRRLLDRPDIDAIFLFTQYEAHRAVILAAAAAGKQVFTQKPLTGSVAEGEALVAAVRQAKVRLVTSFMHNYSPETRLAKRHLDAGAIVRLFFLRQRNATHNRYERAVELRGATWDIGPHGIGMIHHLSGARIVRVQAMMDVFTRSADQRDQNGGRPIDTLAGMNYTLADGCLVSHEVHWTAEAGTTAWLTELFGDTGASCSVRTIAPAWSRVPAVTVNTIGPGTGNTRRWNRKRHAAASSTNSSWTTSASTDTKAPPLTMAWRRCGC
ncbi:MAG: Gfo/Idh/MocA family protein [Chloroflexota bacterium]